MSDSWRRDDGHHVDPELSLLSPREREVLDAAVEGQSAREVARRLSLSEATVRSHLSAIYSKLGVAGRVELMARLYGEAAQRAGEIGEPAIGPSGPTPDAAKPRSPRRAMGVITALSFSLLVAFVVVRPDLPPSSDLVTVSRLVAANEVAQLDLHGDTLTVTERSGERLRVEGVTLDQFQPIQQAGLARLVGITAGNNPFSLTTGIVMIVTSVLPLLLAAAAVVLVFRAVRTAPGSPRLTAPGSPRL